jgi:2-methylcitrate dehydratase PrpD
MAKMDDLSHHLASHVVGTGFNDLPTHVVEVTKRSLQDALGVTLAASSLGECASAFAELAREAQSERGATVIGFGFKAAPAMAAFANGAMAHALDYEDTFDAALMHPNAAVIPAALAIAESLGTVSGRDLITAIAVGADLTCRLGAAVDGHERQELSGRFLAGAIGATTAAAKLLALDEEHLMHAWALVMFQAAFPTEAFSYPTSHMRAVREAFAAKAGVVAARLAMAGVKAFDRPFEAAHGFFSIVTEGEIDTARIMRGLGAVFEGAEVSFKPWPSCRGTHAFIEAALNLRHAHGLRPDDLVGIQTIVSPFFRALVEPPARKRRPETAIDAKFSIPFSVATALQHGCVTLDSFSPDAIRNPIVLDLASRVSHTLERSWGTQEATRGELAIRLRDGRDLSMSIKDPLGHPANPMSAQAMRGKFAECARHARTPLAPGRAEAIAAAIDQLEMSNNITGLLA